MTDSHLRELERRFRASNSEEDEAAWLRARVQASTLEPAKLELAAFLGHAASRRALPTWTRAPTPAQVLMLDADWDPVHRDWLSRIASQASDQRGAEWIAQPLSLAGLLRLPEALWSDDDRVDVDAFLTRAAEALSTWFETLGDRQAELLAGLAALDVAWQTWRPVLQAPAHRPEQVADVLRRLGAVDRAPDAVETPDLAAVRELEQALPRRGPPPPYAGHFYGALGRLLGAFEAPTPPIRRVLLAEALQYSCVSPTGENLALSLEAGIRRGLVPWALAT